MLGLVILDILYILSRPNTEAEINLSCTVNILWDIIIYGVTGVQCCMKISQFDMAVRWVDEGLLLEPENSELLKLKSECEKLKVGLLMLDSNTRLLLEQNSIFSIESPRVTALVKLFSSCLAIINTCICMLQIFTII